MSTALCWPLGFKVDKMWFLVLTGKKGEDGKSLQSVYHVSGPLHMLPLTIGQNTTISHLQCQTFQHIGKEADLM